MSLTVRLSYCSTTCVVTSLCMSNCLWTSIRSVVWKGTGNDCERIVDKDVYTVIEKEEQEEEDWVGLLLVFNFKAVYSFVLRTFLKLWRKPVLNIPLLTAFRGNRGWGTSSPRQLVIEPTWDDTAIFSHSLMLHMQHLEIVSDKIARANLIFNLG